MADQRVKGQDTEVLLVVGGVPQETITDVRSLEVAWMVDTTQEGYLGETSDRFDEIFKGIRGRIELHFENQDVFTLIKSILDRAARRDPAVKINIKTALSMPNGQRPRIVIKDAFFGEVPLAFGSRSDYGTIGLDFRASNADIITT